MSVSSQTFLCESGDDNNLRLRELELQTQYELKYLSDSFKDLKSYVEGTFKRESEKFETLNKKVTFLTWAIVAQMAGIDLSNIISMFKGVL